MDDEIKNAFEQARANTAETRKRLEESESGPNCNKCGRDLVFCNCGATRPRDAEISVLQQRIAALEREIAELRGKAHLTQESADAWKDLAQKYEGMLKSGSYRCFHCGNLFTPEEAAIHFGGRAEGTPAACLLSENAALRKQVEDATKDCQKVNARYERLAERFCDRHLDGEVESCSSCQVEEGQSQLRWLEERLMSIDELHSDAIGLPKGWTDLREGVDAARQEQKEQGR